jgi:hypothetical protein
MVRRMADMPETPDSIALPTDPTKLTEKALGLIDQCRVSAGKRAALCRLINLVMETGRQDGTPSLISLLFSHVDRLASYLFSPTELRFVIDFDEDWPKSTRDRGLKAAKLLTRNWARSDTDMVFARGVFDSLKYGAAILKQWPSPGPGGTVVHNSSLVMPWQFGVLNEGVNDLGMRQPAMCETVLLTLPEVWARIRQMPNAKSLYKRIEVHADKGSAGEDMGNFQHNVLSLSQLQTGSTTQARPGGIVNITNMANHVIFGPEVSAPLVKMHELWVFDDDDYTTIQLIEPDILIEPKVKKRNVLFAGNDPTKGGDEEGSQLHPYNLIQPNQTSSYFWGRSELADLIEPQTLLSTLADDAKRLSGLQVDKFLALIGCDGITDEKYGAMRAAGFMDLPMGASVNDVTPKFPAELLPMIDKVIQVMEMIGGFDNLLSGRGESGVRAGVHASTLLKTASPRLRDRALLVERQCASAADLWLAILEVKDGRRYWTDGTDIKTREETGFFMGDLPDDRHVLVDGHSTSPAFADDLQQLTAFGLKAKIIGPEDAIEDLPFPNREIKLARLKERQAKEAQQMQELIKRDPEAAEKLLSRSGGHR